MTARSDMRGDGVNRKVVILSIAVVLLIGFQAGQFWNQILSRTIPQPFNFNLVQVAHALSTPANFLTFQGRLDDNNGNPITTLKNMAFSIYDQLTSGNLIFNETQNITPDSNGLFYVNIGCSIDSTSNVCTGLSATAGSPTGSQTWPPTFSQPYFLAIRIGTNGAYLTPRVVLTTGPYAWNRASAPIETPVTSSTTCSITSATANQGGFTTASTYTTAALSSGKLYVSMIFNVASPAILALTSTWQFIYGTGSAPTCNTTVSGATAVGRVYTIQTQAAAANSLGQTIGVTISGLIPSTTYWFDLQVTDSSTATWVYSNQNLAISDIISAINQFPALMESDNANTCTHTAAVSTLMGGLGVTYKTLPVGFGSGTVHFRLTFNIKSPAAGATALLARWQVAYGTTATPTCNASSTGTTIGRQYTVEQQVAAVTMQLSQSGSFVLNGLTAATTYWFDIQFAQATSTDQWIVSLPTFAISEEASNNAGNLPDNVVYPLTAQTATCTTSAAASGMAGLKEIYTVTSTSSLSIFATITFGTQASGTIVAGSTSAWTFRYSDITTATMPACAAAVVGTAVGQAYTLKTVSTTAFAIPQSEGVVITGLVAGHTYWFDVSVTNVGTSFVVNYFNPTLTITDIQSSLQANTNVIQLTGNAPTCSDTTASAVMAGMSVIPTTANPPMEYQTLSYGSGNIYLTFSVGAQQGTANLNTQFRLAYGLVTDAIANPACSASIVGTTVGNLYRFSNPTAAISGQMSVSVTISGLAHGAMYWFDFQVTDSTTAAWTYTIPQLSILEAV